MDPFYGYCGKRFINGVEVRETEDGTFHEDECFYSWCVDSFAPIPLVYKEEE